jgi:hypothetical protein
VTNYTHWRDADRLRACAASSAHAQAQVQRLALRRLETFAHVGLMEDLENSILSLAALMGLKMRGPAWKVRMCPPALLLALQSCDTLVTWFAGKGTEWVRRVPVGVPH